MQLVQQTPHFLFFFFTVCHLLSINRTYILLQLLRSSLYVLQTLIYRNVHTHTAVFSLDIINGARKWTIKSYGSYNISGFSIVICTNIKHTLYNEKKWNLRAKKSSCEYPELCQIRQGMYSPLEKTNGLQCSYAYRNPGQKT